jgi:hypothetical protein
MLLISVPVSAQTDPEMRSSDENPEDEKGKPGKVVNPQISLWNLNGYGAFLDSTKLDTLHDYNHIFHPVYKKAWTATYTGNYGSPAMDNNFFNRKPTLNYFFAQTREAYILTPDKLAYFNTHTPYTRLDYTQSENKSRNNETRFNVIHSQNINPWWNFTFRVDLAKSDGQYLSQETGNNSVSLYSSYTKDFLNIHAGFITNSLKNNENGGLINDSLLNFPDNVEFWQVNLEASDTKLNSNFFFATAEYRFGKLIETGENEAFRFRPVMGVLYSFDYNINKHQFNENEDSDNTYFKNSYYPDSYTKDSMVFNELTNVIQLKQYENADKKYSFGTRAFIGFEINRGTMAGPYVENPYQMDYPEGLLGATPNDYQPDSIIRRTDISYSNSFVGGGIFRETGKFWKWNFDGKFYLAGRKLGQTEIRGLIYKPIHFSFDSTASISFNGAIENRVPDYFQEKFYSNHFRWDQGLKMEQRLTAGGKFDMPGHGFELGAKYAVINNYIYNDASGIPNQTGDELLVLSAWLDKDFRYRGLHLRTRVLWQKTSDDRYIHLPDWSAFVSGYYQFTISKVMFTQIGSDVRYNTKYYADAYAPSTGLFYLQNEKQYGNYPYIDVYADLRLKRTRVFFKYMNVGTHFLKGEYMTTPHYPMNRATFRLGVSWAFYD